MPTAPLWGLRRALERRTFIDVDRPPAS